MRKNSCTGLIFAVVILSFLFVLSLILGATGYYFSISYINSDSDLTVGDSFSIGVKSNQSNVASLTFYGSYLPGEMIPQTIQINAQDLNYDMRVRVKAKIFGKNQDETFDFVTSEHFEKSEDGYYYYDDVLRGGNKITFCTYLIVPEDSNLVSKEKYIITFVVETLETKYDEQNIWKNVQ